MYPADEIEKSYMSLNRAPAPLGHPLINSQFVSARDPEGIGGSPRIRNELSARV